MFIFTEATPSTACQSLSHQIPTLGLRLGGVCAYPAAKIASLRLGPSYLVI
jgi:hypothetical protein